MKHLDLIGEIEKDNDLKAKIKKEIAIWTIKEKGAYGTFVGILENMLNVNLYKFIDIENFKNEELYDIKLNKNDFSMYYINEEGTGMFTYLIEYVENVFKYDVKYLKKFIELVELDPLLFFENKDIDDYLSLIFELLEIVKYELSLDAYLPFNILNKLELNAVFFNSSPVPFKLNKRGKRMCIN